MTEDERNRILARIEAQDRWVEERVAAKKGKKLPPPSHLANLLVNADTPADLAAKLHKTVVGQEEAVRRCAVALRHHLLRAQHCFMQGVNAEPLPKSTVLLIGPTGTGKTILASAMAQVAEVPFHCEDCTQLSETGYVGRDVADIVLAMAQSWTESLVAPYGVLFLDELDKVTLKATPYRDITGAGVQDGLLKLIEGGSLQPTRRKPSGQLTLDDVLPSGFSTDKLLIVAAGAFVGLDELVKDRTKPTSRLGFTARPTEDAAHGGGLRHLIPDDLISYGLKPELVGRFTDIIVLSDLGREELLTILSMEDGPIGKRRRIAKMEGFDLQFTSALQEAIVDQCLKAGLGARMLESVVGKLTARVFYEVPEKVKKTSLKEPVVTLEVDALAAGEYSLEERIRRRPKKTVAEP